MFQDISKNLFLCYTLKEFFGQTVTMAVIRCSAPKSGSAKKRAGVKYLFSLRKDYYEKNSQFYH